MERVAFSQMFTARGTASWKSLHLSHWAFIWRGDWIGRVRRIAAADQRAGPLAEKFPKQRDRETFVANADVQSVRLAALRG